MSTKPVIGIICDHDNKSLEEALSASGYETICYQASQLDPDRAPPVDSWVIDCNDENQLADELLLLEPMVTLSNRPPLDNDDYGHWADKIIRSLDKRTADVRHSSSEERSSTPQETTGVQGVWILAGSTGCVGAVSEFFYELSPLPPVAFIYAQHVSPEKQNSLVTVGRANRELECELALGRHWLNPGHVLVAPANARIEFTKHGEVFSQNKPWGTPETPNIDQLMMSMSGMTPFPAGAIIFSGAGKDSLEGAKALKAVGSRIWAQDPATADDPSMPHHAIQSGLADYVASPSELAQAFLRLYAG
jgi:chemotaxis response regulator CheB